MARRRFYTPADVAIHNTSKDCWVSILGRVFDLTELIAKNRGPLTQPLVDVRNCCPKGRGITRNKTPRCPASRAVCLPPSLVSTPFYCNTTNRMPERTCPTGSMRRRAA